MARVDIAGLSKSYGSHTALAGLDLTIENGELLCVLGPSGCGKTTLLRLVAGLETADAGEIRLGGNRVSGAGVHVPPEARNVGVVFQSYALWPHMTVAGNAGFPLKVAGLSAAERERRVSDALDAVRLGALAARRPHQLSGGQQQRVALARCLTQAPAIVCMDEPLANLDVHLREDMLAEFRRFHRATGATMLYITHDQAEAMSIADRVAVLLDGRLEQAAAPETLYDRPATAAVARFVGAASVVPAETVANGAGPSVRFAGGVLPIEGPAPLAPGRRVGLVLRPEQPALGAGSFAGKVSAATYLGGRYRIDLDVAHDGAVVSLRAFSDRRLSPGETVAFDLGRVWAIPA